MRTFAAAILMLGLVGFLPAPAGCGQPSKQAELPSESEARGQARILHETMHATLHAVHHEYYREDEGLTIPAATLEKVFKALAKQQQVELRWLAVEGQAMNTDHVPINEFEKQAAAALASGKQEFERTDDGVYRRAAPIALTSDCLKCHSPNRKSNADLTAGLIIGLPIRKP